MSNEAEKQKLRNKRKGDAKATARPQTIRAEAEQRKQIATWNREPLKHYVRREGWGTVIEVFLHKLRACGITRPWKYLTFPGPDALDIGFFYQKRLLDVTPNGRLSVAICDQENADKVALRLEKFGGVLASSQQWLHVALMNAGDALVREFPFDVINMDLCNSLILQNRNNLRALDQVFALQRGQGFLLLLTSRPEPNQRDEHLGILADNLQNEPEFQDMYTAKYGTNEPEACLDDYTTFTQIVFSKIIAKYGREFGYKVCEHFTARYRKPDGFDMITHSFELDPIVGKRQCSTKYEPRFPEPHRDRIEQMIRGELPKRVREEADGEYTEFICCLPDREVLNINEFLADKPALVDDLTRDAASLETWMK